MPLTEKEYNELYKYSLHIAYKYLGYKDDAFDVAQNAILSLISAKVSVNSPFSWLRTTVKRESFKFINSENKQKETNYKSIKKDIEIHVDHDEETDRIFKYSVQKLKRILSPQDFDLFLKLKSYEFSVSQFAKFEKINVGTAKTIKRRIQRNITAAYLLEDGWSRGTRILTYTQYINISRCISKIIESVRKQKLNNLRNYLQSIDNADLFKIFDGVEECLEWSVAYLEGNYVLMLVCAPINPFPILILLTIKFTKANNLYIINAENKLPILIVNKPADEIMKYKEKGKINLTTEQIGSILSDKNTIT